MDRCTNIPYCDEHPGDPGLANIQRLAPYRPSLFHSGDGHMELRVDLIPLISSLVYRALGLCGAVHRTGVLGNKSLRRYVVVQAILPGTEAFGKMIEIGRETVDSLARPSAFF